MEISRFLLESSIEAQRGYPLHKGGSRQLEKAMALMPKEKFLGRGL